MGVNRVKNNCTSGELDPLLHSRADIKQWANGLRTARNVRLLPQGGFRRREGSEFLQELLNKLELQTDDITVTVPNGGTPPSPDEDPLDPDPPYRCVVAETWLTAALQAKDARKGDVLTVMGDDLVFVQAPIDGLRKGREACFRLVTASGAVLECSRSTPFLTESEGRVLVGAMMGRRVLVETAPEQFEWQVVTSVRRIGERDVVHITVGDRNFAAGADAARRIVSHNIKPIEP